MKSYTNIDTKSIFIFLAGILYLTSFSLFSQTENFDELRESHRETLDDTYTFISRDNMEKSPAYKFKSRGFETTQVNVDSDGNNIVGDAGNETSIAVDPTNPNRIVIGWRQFDTVDSNFRQAGYGYSTDGGLTWTFPGVINPGVFRSDPVLDFDAEGNFYYNSLTLDFECDVYKIDDGGVSWGPPVPAAGGDKQWMRIDKTSGIGAGNNYSNWNSAFTTCAPGFYTRSTNGSASFENCEIVDGDPFWGTLAVDADGDLYIVGRSSSEFIIAKSSNAKDPDASLTWDSVNVVNLDGNLVAGAPVNPSGLLGQGWVDVDISGGSGHGNVYVAASVARFSGGDPGDVMFAKSTDGGNIFSDPIRINTDASTTNYQWFGTMSVAPNGRIDIIWLDTRNAPAGTNMSELYYSFSEDQGETWSVNQSLSVLFDPNIGYPQQNKMGDYFDMISHNDVAHLAWANTINGGQDVYYTKIFPSTLGIDDFTENNLNIINYPNPFSDETTIEFYLQNEEHVIVTVFDLLGKKVNTLLNKKAVGNNSLIWDGSNNAGQKLNTGLYFISIQAGNNTAILKAVLQ